MKLSAVLIVVIFYSFSSNSQSVDITESIDALTNTWDKEAVLLKTYEGMRGYCKSQPKRAELITLVKEIHHYDSILYKTVKDKFDENQDAEAKATLKDIKKLESEYTTKAFLDFIHHECSAFNTIEKNYGHTKGKPYEKEKAKMEKVLVKYVEEVTLQIDIIDEHIHHLNGL
ncbi:MAG: hypothetical protein JXR07_17820 [Reichenbachiella sp.]